jgi:hypothetical protein
MTTQVNHHRKIFTLSSLITKQPTRVILEKLIVSQPVNKFCLLLNLKVHYRVHKGPPLHSILSQINPVHIIIHYYYKTILIMSSRLSLDLPNVIFPSRFPVKTCEFLISLSCMLHGPPITIDYFSHARKDRLAVSYALVSHPITFDSTHDSPRILVWETALSPLCACTYNLLSFITLIWQPYEHLWRNRH